MGGNDQFKWFTMVQLADFSQRRLQTAWTSSSHNGRATFNASNPASLTDVTWLLPRTSDGQPSIHSGRASVGSDSPYWVVTAESGNSLNFSASER